MYDKKELLAGIPEKPGVYIMKDIQKEIIYIGKANVLKNRLGQYFQSSGNHTEKTLTMISNIDDIEYIITESEMEALILECNLIKRYKPRFNILLKDSRTYPFIKITLKDDYPRVFITRNFEKDGSKYYGPYSSAGLVSATLRVIKDVFKVRECNKNLDNKNERPCLNYHIKRCNGPCNGHVSKGEYQEIIKEVCLFLDGNQGEIIKKLRGSMETASQNMEYEKAATYRDRINGLKHVLNKQRVFSTSKDDRDVIASVSDNNTVMVVLFFVRGGLLIGSKNFVFENEKQEETEEIITAFMKQFYSLMDFIPKTILLDRELEDKKALESWLGEKNGLKVQIIKPERGENARIIEMASQNAKMAIIKHKHKMSDELNIDVYGILNELKEKLGLIDIPKRIEAYDISNTGISEVVGCMIVYENGKPSKVNYRKFKIKTSLETPDDYLCMQEVIHRRLRKLGKFANNSNEDKKDESFDKKPDLILIDGGIGHLNCVLKVMSELEIEIPVFGMVKDGKHRTRDLISIDGEMNIKQNKEMFTFVTGIQNEVHRFTLEYNKKLRTKRYRESALENVQGVGVKKKKSLIKYFGSVNKIRLAKVDEIEKVEGINEALAKKIYDYFRNK